MKVTVLLCVKNGENFISDTINSILNQSYKDFEFIIVVNCSTDKTLEIVNSYNDSRIKVYETKIGQLSFNLNYGLNIAKGEYIARIDADDIAVKDRLKLQLELIDNQGFDIVGSNIEYIDTDNTSLGYEKYPQSNKEIRRKIKYKSVLAHPSVMFKKDVVLDVGGYLGGKYAQDYDLWLRLMRNKNIKFHNIQMPLLKYRIHENQVKGNKLSYGEVAGYFLKETFYSKKLSNIMSSLIYFIKGMIR